MVTTTTIITTMIPMDISDGEYSFSSSPLPALLATFVGSALVVGATGSAFFIIGLSMLPFCMIAFLSSALFIESFLRPTFLVVEVLLLVVGFFGIAISRN